jgi:NADH pyrophosphatase NudC (nudix superfamily)
MEPQDYYKFCPKCKSELVSLGDNPFRFICNNCGFHYYTDPIPVNGLIIHDVHQGLLLVERKKEPEKGKWDLTGGFVAINETIEKSVGREVKEELGINIPYFHYFRSYPQRYLYKGANLYVIAFIYYVKVNISLANLTPDDDVASAKFFPLDKIPWKDIAFEGITQALKDYIKQL